MRVAALYDVHGNLPALAAVLADPRCAAADVVVCGGDLCAGPMPVEALRLMFCHGSPRSDDEILGHDVELVGTQYDVAAAVAAIRATGYPDADDFAETLLTPHAAGEATKSFEARRRGA